MLKSSKSLISTINKMTPASSLIKVEVTEASKDKNINKTKKEDVKVEELI